MQRTEGRDHEHRQRQLQHRDDDDQLDGGCLVHEGLQHPGHRWRRHVLGAGQRQRHEAARSVAATGLDRAQVVGVLARSDPGRCRQVVLAEVAGHNAEGKR